MELVKKLAKLYHDDSKHSNYQNVPKFVSEELGYSEEINEEWRGDTARFKYLLENLKKMKIISISDIGANTGFFTLSIAHKYPNIVCNAYELNESHTNHIKVVRDHFRLDNLNVYKKGIMLSNVSDMKNSDVTINLNVLHHAGVDFDSELIADIKQFDSYAIEYLDKLRKVTNFMFFQMGYNWGGNKSKPLIRVGNINQFIKWSQNLFTSSCWKINSIGIYNNYTKTYQVLNSKLTNNLLNNSYRTKNNYSFSVFLEKIGFENNSEFYKRPLFLLENNTEC